MDVEMLTEFYALVTCLLLSIILAENQKENRLKSRLVKKSKKGTCNVL
jgi:hypothetical protein